MKNGGGGARDGSFSTQIVKENIKLLVFSMHVLLCAHSNISKYVLIFALDNIFTVILFFLLLLTRRWLQNLVLRHVYHERFSVILSRFKVSKKC